MVSALQKQVALSIAWICLALSLAGLAWPAGATGVAACRGIGAQWACEAGAPVLRVTQRGSAPGIAHDMAYELAATHPGTALGDRVLRLSRGGAVSAPVALSTPGRAPGLRLSVAGMGAGGACCFSTLGVPQLPAGLCDQARPDPDPDPTPDPNPAIGDTALALTLTAPCPEGPAGNSCTGVLTLDHAGPLPQAGVLPLTLSATGASIVGQSLTGPLGCRPVAGAETLFCQVPGALLAAVPLDLPLRVETAHVYGPATLRLCAAYDAPGDDRTRIALVQTALAALGLDPGPTDGQAGPKTRAAVVAFAARAGIQGDDPLAPDILKALGLGALEDGDLGNNRACSSADLIPRPPPDCDGETAMARGGECVCRYARMRLRGGGASCACARGTRFVAGAGCVTTDKTPDNTDPPRLACDPASTVLRGGRCACRFKGMMRLSNTSCACLTGVPPGTAGCGG